MKDRNEHLFIIRVWKEDRADWRGFVEHVSTQQRVYFTDVAQLADWLFLRLGDADLKQVDSR